MDFLTRMPEMTGTTDEDVKRCFDYTVQIKDEMRYYLNNLDMTNFNDVAWDNIVQDLISLTAGEINISTEQLRIALTEAEGRLNGKITASAEGVTAAFQAADDDLDDYLSGQITATATGLRSEFQSADRGLSGRINTVSSSVQQNARSISAIVTSVGSGGTVTAASIVAAINAEGSSVKISADNIDLSGTVTISDLETPGQVKIDGGNITGGTIEGVKLRSRGSNGEQIFIADGMIGFESGYIVDKSNGYLELKADDVLNLKGYSAVRIQIGNRGEYWEFTLTNIIAYDHTGHEMGRVAFQ